MRGISLKLASELVNNIFAMADKMGLPPLSVVLLDTGGHIKISQSQDGVGTLRHQIAQGKANAALGMGIDTIDLFQLFERGILPERFANGVNGAANGVFRLVTRRGLRRRWLRVSVQYGQRQNMLVLSFLFPCSIKSCFLINIASCKLKC